MTDGHSIWNDDAYWPSEPDQQLTKSADNRHLEKSKNVVLLKTGNKTANIKTFNGDGSKTAKKSWKSNVNHTNNDSQAMLMWLTLPFYDFCFVFDPSPLTVCINCRFYPLCAGNRHARVSVCPCVARRYCIKTAKRRITQTTPREIAQGI